MTGDPVTTPDTLGDQPDLGPVRPAADRFAWLIEHVADPPPTTEQWEAIGFPPDWFENLLCDLDGLARRLAVGDRTEPWPPLLAPGDTKPIPDEVYLARAAADMAAASVRGLLHRYLNKEGNGPDDPLALLIQGILVGAEMTGQAEHNSLFSRGYGPWPRNVAPVDPDSEKD